MRSPLSYIMILISLAACRNAGMEKPVWLNAKNMVALPADTLFFQATGKNWNAAINSFIQPISLNIGYTKTGFYLVSKNKSGITEGPAQLVLTHEKNDFFYDVVLKNSSSGAIIYKDYRSPKTLNPDSSLDQHIMIHRVDEWRNILDLPGSSTAFRENISPLTPVAGTYRAQPENPLSAYYLQPGSATSIDVNTVFENKRRVYEVSAGPLKDKHNNIVADGTLVAFVYSDGIQTYRMEASLLNGFAKITIPAENIRPYTLTAQVNNTISKRIKLDLK